MPRKATELRYALYVRVSSDRQDIENSMSAQEAAARRFVEAHGGRIVVTYRDEAKTGKVALRPGFQNMIADAGKEPCPFDAVLVWKFSRFARNREVSVAYKAMLAEYGIRVISISENTGDNPAGRMVEGIIESVDEFHSANMSVDIKQGMRNSTERGFYLARSAPTGYKIVHVRDGGKYRPKLELDPPWDLIPRRAFQLALADYGLKRIAQKMHEEGIRGKNGGIITRNKVSRMLHNPHYTGYTFWDYQKKNGNFAKSIEQAHEAIVTPEEWESVQKKMAARDRNSVHPRTAAAPYLFNDLGLCMQCGHRIGMKGSHGNKYTYFMCCTRLKLGKKACDLPRYPLSLNEPAILDVIISDVLSGHNIKTLIDHVQAVAPETHRTTQDKFAELEAQLDNLDSRETQLLMALEMQTFDMAKIQDRMDAIKGEREAIEERRQAVLAETDTEAAFLQDPDLILAFAKDLTTYLRKATVISANAMLKRMISSLEFEKGFVTINYMIPLPDGTPVGPNYRRVALKKGVSPTVAVGPPSTVGSSRT